MSITKAQIKLIRSLDQKKYRQETSLFIAEGKKVVKEFIQHQWKPYLIIATEKWASTNSAIGSVVVVEPEIIQKITLLKSPPEVIGVFYQKESKVSNIHNSLGIALDEVQDAGNVGTIMRLALWFGLDYMVLGNGCADRFNPKVIQASMGAVASLPCIQVTLNDFFEKHKELPVYGTFLEGTPIHKTKLTSNGVILLGNEGKGISKLLEPYVKHKIFIPPFSKKNKPIDSLNVAMAASIVCYEFRRGKC